MFGVFEGRMFNLIVTAPAGVLEAPGIYLMGDLQTFKCYLAPLNSELYCLSSTSSTSSTSSFAYSLVPFLSVF